jgi:copper homeostasis protein
LPRLVEICAFSVADAGAAAAAGADRIELCRAPEADGLTPDRVDLLQAVALLPQLPVHPIVREHDTFEVDRAEVRRMSRKIAQVRALGYPGVVVGALREATPDWAAVREFVEAAEGGSVTFHRAFDLVDDQLGALEGLAAAGVARILTSGRPGVAHHNATLLARLAARGSECGVVVMAGGGVTSRRLDALRRAGLREIHASARRGGPGVSPDEVGALVTGWHRV